MNNYQLIFNKLKPCFFCHKTDSIYLTRVKKFFATTYYIGCHNCDIEMDYATPEVGGKSLREVEEKWNNK